MLRPSYSDLLEALAKDKDNDSIAASRYTIVIAAAKRARQLVEDPTPLCPGNVDKPVSIAVKELYEGKIKIKQKEEDDINEESLADSEQENIGGELPAEETEE